MKYCKENDEIIEKPFELVAIFLIVNEKFKQYRLSKCWRQNLRRPSLTAYYRGP